MHAESISVKTIVYRTVADTVKTEEVGNTVAGRLSSLQHSCRAWQSDRSDQWSVPWQPSVVNDAT